MQRREFVSMFATFRTDVEAHAAERVTNPARAADRRATKHLDLDLSLARRGDHLHPPLLVLVEQQRPPNLRIHNRNARRPRHLAGGRS